MNQANNQTANVVTLHPIVIRYNPISKTPVVFIADKPPVNDQVELVLESNEHRFVDYQYYKHTTQLPQDQIGEVAERYAEMAGVPMDALHIRERMPKKTKETTQQSKPQKKQVRHTNDAHISGGGIPQRRASDKKEVDERNQDDLTKAVQEMQNEHDAEKGKATPSNPEGATVTPIKSAKRAYHRKSPEEKAEAAQRSKRSQAALRQYQNDVLQAAEKNNILVEQASSAVSEEERNKALFELGQAVAKALAIIV